MQSLGKELLNNTAKTTKTEVSSSLGFVDYPIVFLVFFKFEHDFPFP